MSGPDGTERREPRRLADKRAVWVERGFLFAITALLSLVVWVFEKVPDQLQANEKATALLTYQVAKLTEEVKELNGVRGDLAAVEKDVELLDKRVTKLEDGRYSMWPQKSGKR